MVLVMVRLVRRLTGSTLLGGVAGLLLCFDGLHFVLSRLALLDIFVALFLLSAVSCLVADRDWGRARMAAVLATGQRYHPADWGPVRELRWRPWRLAAGVLFGLAIGCKWSALVPLAGFGLLVLLWDAGARRALGSAEPRAQGGRGGRHARVRLPRRGRPRRLRRLLGRLAGARRRVRGQPGTQRLRPYWGDYTKNDPDGFFPSLFQGLRSLWHYHTDVWQFHSSGLVDADALLPVRRRGAGWCMQRPVVAAVDLDITPGSQGCTAPTDSTCLREVIILGTPVLWWGGVPRLAVRGVQLGGASRLAVGAASSSACSRRGLPFFRYADRPIFSFYAVTTLPFIIVAVCLVIGRLIGPAEAAPRRRLVGTVVSGAFVVLVMLHFAWLWPVYTNELHHHAGLAGPDLVPLLDLGAERQALEAPDVVTRRVATRRTVDLEAQGSGRAPPPA